MAYATRDDVFNLGLSAVAFVSRPRPVECANVDLTTGRIRLKAHGLAASDLVTLEQVARGSLPVDYYGATLSGFVQYAPIPVGADLFQLTNPSDGQPLAFTATGSGWGVTVDMYRRLDMIIEATAGEIDECLTAQSPPIKPDPITGLIPWQLRGMNARMAALRMVGTLQVENAESRLAVDRILAQDKKDDVTRGEWKMGKPLLPNVVDQDTLADDAPRARSRCAIGWARRTI